jgi:hypothetical protein
VTGQWILLAPSGEVGRVTVAPGALAAGPGHPEDLETATSYDADDEDTSFPMAKDDGHWGRIGHRGPTGIVAEGEVRSLESEGFRRLMTGVPDLGERVSTPTGPATVIRVDPFAGIVEVRSPLSDEGVTLPLGDVRRNGPGAGKSSTTRPEGAGDGAVPGDSHTP